MYFDRSNSENDWKKVRLPVFFFDETGILNKSDDPFFALGVVRTERPHELQRSIKSIRDRKHYYEEIKWNKISPIKFGVVKEVINAFFQNKHATFSCNIIKKSELDFNHYFSNDLNKVYRSFSIRLLNMNIQPNEVCTVIADDYFYPAGVNLELAIRGILNDKLKRLAVSGFLQIDSKSSDLLQVTDILLGAVLYDLKLVDGFIKPHSNFKMQTLNFLRSKLGTANSFFIKSSGERQDHFLREKFKISIFHGRQEGQIE